MITDFEVESELGERVCFNRTARNGSIVITQSGSSFKLYNVKRKDGSIVITHVYSDASYSALQRKATSAAKAKKEKVAAGLAEYYGRKARKDAERCAATTGDVVLAQKVYKEGIARAMRYE